MTSADGGEYHTPALLRDVVSPPGKTGQRDLPVEIRLLCPIQREAWCRSSRVSSYSCGGGVDGSGRAQELVFDLTSFSLKDDASSLLLALPESSLQEICGPHCTQEQNISLSSCGRGAAALTRQESSITQMKPRPRHPGRENQIPSTGKRFQSLLYQLSSATTMLHTHNREQQWPVLVNI